MKQSVDDALDIRLATAIDRGGGVEPQPPPETAAALAPARKKDKRKSPSSIPPYALNPHRVATITDIESRTRRLFAPLKVPVDKALVMKLATFKPVAVNRNASTVAAYFNRQIEQNQLLPKQRKAVQRVDKQFFDVRRSIFADERLTKQDKAQLVSVLTFERMKAREAIQKPHLNKEATYMGSAEIRGLISEEPQQDVPEFSISGPGLNSPVRDRVKTLIARLTLQTNDRVSKERERELSGKDIYTKKSRFSQNVHYLSKSTDKTLFVDTGTAIAMRRTGITEAGVGVALQLATQRFGSTLTINGSAEFKRLVVEAAAKGGMDIHFTDKKMNEALKLRCADLDIGKEAEQIQSPESAEADSLSQQAIPPSETAAPVIIDRSIVVGELVAHGPDSYQGDAKNGPSYFVELNTEAGPKKLWGVALKEAMSQYDFALGDRIKLKDLGREAVTLLKPQPDGSTKPTPGFRRAWSAEPEITTQVKESAVAHAALVSDQPATATVVAPADSAPAKLTLVAPAVAAVVPATLASATSALNASVSPSELVRREQAWRDKFPLDEHSVLTEAEVLSSDVMMGLRGEDHAIWLVATSDHTKEGVAMITAYMENDEYRERFKRTIEDLYDQHQESPEIIKGFDEATDFVEPLVHEIEARLWAAAESPQSAQDTPAPLNFTHNGEAASLGLKPAPVLTTPVVEPAAAAPRVEAPAPLNFTHNGEAASLGLKPAPALMTPVVEPAAAAPRVEAPAPLNFTHNGEAASLGLKPAPALTTPVVEPAAAAPRVEAPAPLNFTHNGEAASLGLKPAPALTTPVVEPAAAAPRVEAPAPLNFTHNGQPAALWLNKGAADLHDSEPEASETVVVETIIVNEEEYGPEMN